MTLNKRVTSLTFTEKGLWVWNDRLRRLHTVHPFFIVWLLTSQRLLAAFCSAKDNAQESAKGVHSLPAFHIPISAAEQH